MPEEERPQVHKSTLDTSKIDENHPNGKVIEDEEEEKPTDEDKENKTDDQVWKLAYTNWMILCFTAHNCLINFNDVKSINIIY